MRTFTELGSNRDYACNPGRTLRKPQTDAIQMVDAEAE